MFVSKAMLNMRGDSLGSSTPAVEAPWMPITFTAGSAVQQQSAGSPIGAEVAAAIVFSTGDVITDDIWNTMSGSLFSLNTLRTFLTANLPACVMDTAFQSTGRLRIVNLGSGRRMFDMSDTTLGRFAYAKPFNRLYVLMSTSTTAAVGTANISSVLELTGQDLQQMGAPVTDNGDGTFTLNGVVVMNNITFS